ncbi:MAG: hypothetical protein QW379_05085 [Thermoplasmata archaeon]
MGFGPGPSRVMDHIDWKVRAPPSGSQKFSSTFVTASLPSMSSMGEKS